MTRMKHATRLLRSATDLALNQEYVFRMGVHPQRYELAVWPVEQSERAAQLRADEPLERLPQGSVGILAANIGVRLYEYVVTPLPDTRSSH